MSDRDTFGPLLRAERERRGISLDTIASVTKVSVDLWEGLERNDFSRWPSGIFARAFVRDYARAIGLDGDDVVNEFCRLFPIGDRRAARLIRAQAELIGHEPILAEEPGGLPAGVDRRAAGQPREPWVQSLRKLLAPRSVAAGIDTLCVLLAARGLAEIVSGSYWPALGVMAVLYYGLATVILGTSPGSRVVDALRHRMPALFAVHDRVHA